MPINIETKRPKSALLRGVRITEFENNLINPDPIVLEDTDFLLEEFLSPTKLKALTGVDDLYSVENLEMIVDTSETSLGNFGIYLPKIKQLKLNSSVIPKIRDLGTSLSHLCILWMTRSCLHDLDGLPAFTSLQELYLAYNEINDLSPCSMLDNLKVLDLEGNLIEDIRQVEFLSLCSNLKNLTLEGNPICMKPHQDNKENTAYNYRNEVLKILPNIEILDDKQKKSQNTCKKESEQRENQAYFDNDWKAINKWIEEGIGPPEEKLAFNETRRPLSSSTKVESPLNYLRPLSAMRPLSSCRPGSALNSRRTNTSNSRKSSPASQTDNTTQFLTDEQLDDLTNDSSKLTLGPVLQGNPLRGLRSRRKLNKMVDDSNKTEFTYIRAPSACESSTTNKTQTNTQSKDIVQDSHLLKELNSWRREHEMKMEVRKKYFEPQVLKIEDDTYFESYDVDDDEVVEYTDENVSYAAEEQHQEEYNQRVSLISHSSLNVSSPPYSSEPTSRIQTSDTGYTSLSESRTSMKRDLSSSRITLKSPRDHQQPVIVSSSSSIITNQHKMTSPNTSLSSNSSSLSQLRKNLKPLSSIKLPK